jgi:hypothetical protein
MLVWGCSNILHLMGIFPLPPPSPTTNITPINMISSFTSGSLGSFDPWVVPHPEDVESYGASMPLTMVDIVDPKSHQHPLDTGQQLHPHMECDQPTPPIWVVDSPSSHDFLDIEFPSEEAILEVMASIENPKDEVMHQSSFPDLEPMRVSMMSLDPDWGNLLGHPVDLLVLTLFHLGYLFQNLPLNSLLPLPSKIHVSYFLHVLMDPIKELP